MSKVFLVIVWFCDMWMCSLMVKIELIFNLFGFVFYYKCINKDYLDFDYWLKIKLVSNLFG